MKTDLTTAPSAVEQLALLPETGRVRAHRRRLDDRTRRIGLAGVAEAQAILAQQARRRAERELRGQTLAHRDAA